MKLVPVLGLLTTAGWVRADTTYYCKGKGTAALDGKTRDSTIEVWMKSPTKFRIEEKVAGKMRVTIANGKDAWTVDPYAWTGTHAKQDAGTLADLKQRKRAVGSELAMFLKQGGKKRGEEKLEGSLCDVYRLKD